MYGSARARGCNSPAPLTQAQGPEVRRIAWVQANLSFARPQARSLLVAVPTCPMALLGHYDSPGEF